MDRYQLNREEEEKQRIQKIVRREMGRRRPPIFFYLLVLVLIVLLSMRLFWLPKRELEMAKEVRSLSDSQEQQEEKVIILSDKGLTVERRVAEKSMPSMVGISTTVEQRGFFGTSLRHATGSGVIFDKSGYVLTNSHVVEHGQAIDIAVLLWEGEEVEGELLWWDPFLDLAVIQIPERAGGYQPISLGDSDDVHIGDKAIAIGNPLGLDLYSSLTSGYVSGLNRSVPVSQGLQATVMSGLIQTDAAINYGNSGGALLNAKGELIGINTLRMMEGEGIGFAIPVNVAKPVIETIISTGEYSPEPLGIAVMELRFFEEQTGYRIGVDHGVLITEVVPGSLAERSGLRAYDIIVSMDEEEVENTSDLAQKLLFYSPGEVLTLGVYREGAGEMKIYIQT